MRLNNFFFAIYNNKRFWRLIVTNNASSIDNYNIIAFLGDKLELEFNTDLEPGFWASLDGSPFFYFTLTRVLMAIAIITA